MKISIVMLAYNHERFIAQALDSILMQKTAFEYEVIIGEDCSSDRTRQIVKAYESKFGPRLKPLYRERNMGAFRNLIDCLEHCKGEYLAFLEGDDYWDSAYKLEIQTRYLDEHPNCVLCAHNWNIVDINGSFIRHGMDINQILDYGREQLDSFTIPAQAATLMMRNIYQEIKTKYGKVVKRYCWIPLDTLIGPILLTYGDIVVLPDVLSNYRWYIEAGGSNWSSKHAIEVKSNRLYFYILILGEEAFSRRLGIEIDCMDKKVELFYDNYGSRKRKKALQAKLSVYIQTVAMFLIEPHRILLIKKAAERKAARKKRAFEVENSNRNK